MIARKGVRPDCNARTSAIGANCRFRSGGSWHEGSSAANRESDFHPGSGHAPSACEWAL